MKIRTQSTIKDNITVGDGKHQEELCKGFGDEMVKKGEELIRILFQNVNGIKGKISASHKVFDDIMDKELDIMVIAEINVNWMDKVKQEDQLEVQMRFGKGQVVASSTRGSKQGYLPGGTAIVTRARMTGSIEKRGVDEMSRY